MVEVVVQDTAIAKQDVSADNNEVLAIADIVEIHSGTSCSVAITDSDSARNSVDESMNLTELLKSEKALLVINTSKNDAKQLEEVGALATPAAPSHFYRADIDGMRTIAVVAVVVFHAWPEAFPGGFIGVDIFFVLSGFLISGIIFKQALKNKFTYADFYSRRIRRIYPALLLVLLVTLVFGFYALTGIELEAMSSTLVGSTVFCANLQILSLKGGYFDADVKLNPLLHMWSLGVEEQFYIVWPFLAALIIKSSPKKGMAILVVFAVLSFIFNVAMVYDNAKFSFYFPLCRFWQMAIGGLIAYCEERHHALVTNTVRTKLATPISTTGLLSIMIGFSLLAEESLFPGWWAALPTIGTALMIVAGPDAYFNKNVLSTRIFVFIGKISYPLYLWHWPLLVYSRVLFRSTESTSLFANPSVMVLLAVFAAIATYYLIENRVRYHKSKAIVFVCAGLMLLMTIAGTVVMKNPDSFSMFEIAKKKGAVDNTLIDNSQNATANATIVLNSSRTPHLANTSIEKIQAAVGDWQYPPPEFVYVNGSSPYDTGNAESYTLNDGQSYKILVMGDSHANMVSHRFTTLYKAWQSAGNNMSSFPTIIYKTQNGCAALPCHYSFRTNLDLIQKVLPQRVLIVMNWELYLRPGGAPTDPLHENPRCCQQHGEKCEYQSPKDVDFLLEGFYNGLKEITSKGIELFVATLNPTSSAFNPLNMYDPTGILEAALKPISKSDFRKKNEELITKVENLVHKSGATLIDFAENQCWNDVCEVLDPYGYPIMKDDDHFRPFYSAKYVSAVDRVLPIKVPLS